MKAPQDSGGENEPEFLEEKHSSALPARVEKVLVRGISRTKDDFIAKNVQSIFTTSNVEELLRRVHDVMLRFQEHKIFSKVSAKVDTCPGDDCYQVTYNVQENRAFSGGVHLQVGTNDGSTVTRAKLPNLFGRAEKVQFEYEYGTRQSRGFGLGLTKPLNADPNIRLGATAYKGQMDYTWSGYKQIDNAVALDLTFPFLTGLHTLKWEGVWRDLRCLSNVTSFAVREQAGHTLKSAIKHEFRRDGRDDGILPTTGTLLKLKQEFAGLGGDAKFYRSDFEFQVNRSLPLATVVQLSLAAGVIKPLDINRPITISDRLFLGGPLTMRGFTQNGVGPHSDGNALGAESYWLGAFHVYSPFPFRKGGFGQLFRSHLFINTGNCWENSNFSLDRGAKDSFQSLTQGMRMSYGVGVVLNMMSIARLEINYVVPLWKQPGDNVNPGLQFGVGIQFL